MGGSPLSDLDSPVKKHKTKKVKVKKKKDKKSSKNKSPKSNLYQNTASLAAFNVYESLSSDEGEYVESEYSNSTATYSSKPHKVKEKKSHDRYSIEAALEKKKA